LSGPDGSSPSLNQRPIEVIEIRAVRNGVVITAIHVGCGRYDTADCRGYQTRVVELQDGELFDAVAERCGRVIADLLRETPITQETVIPPARRLP
jgi:hypothetical protein